MMYKMKDCTFFLAFLLMVSTQVGDAHQNTSPYQTYGKRKMLGSAALNVSSNHLPQPPHNSYGHAALQGKRATMEDAFNSTYCNGISLFGIYDGHGGSWVAQSVASSLNKTISTHLETSNLTYENLISESYRYVDKGLQRSWSGWWGSSQYTGTTAITALVDPYYIVAANVGDSRIVLYSNHKAIPLTNDHKPSMVDEFKRIDTFLDQEYENLPDKKECIRNKTDTPDGFNYIQNEDMQYGMLSGRMAIAANATINTLAVSRAIGDHAFCKAGLTAIPEIRRIDRQKDDLFLILACDGVWDVLSNQEACTLVNKALIKEDTSAQEAAALLVQTALTNGSGDNISAIVVDLRKL